jgi:hypothetical protein
MGSDPPSALSLLYIVTGTLIPNRIRKIVKSPLPAFDLNIEGEHSHYIQITFILLINGDERNHGSCNININDIL